MEHEATAKARKQPKSRVLRNALAVLAVCTTISTLFAVAYHSFSSATRAYESIRTIKQISAQLQPSAQIPKRAPIVVAEKSISISAGESSRSVATPNFCDELELETNAVSSEGHHFFPQGLEQNTSVSGVVALGRYDYFQVCVANHPHHHKIEFYLTCHNSDKSIHVSNADMYISVETHRPTFDHGATWISADRGDDYIGISSYLDEFAAAPSTKSGRGKILFVGVYGREVLTHGTPDLSARGVPYTLTALIRNIPEREAAKHFSLRGKAADLA